MRILIIGGSGFIGPDVVACLSRLGHEIILFSRDASYFNGIDRIIHIAGDLRNFERFRPRLADLGPEVVLEDMFHFSTLDADRVIRTLKGIAQRIVAVSGTDVYLAYGRLFLLEPGPVEPVPVTEDSPLRKRMFPGMRGYDKLVVEPAIMGDADMPGTILRLPPVYGPRSLMHRIYFYLKRMDDNRPFILLSRYLAAWQWSHGYVENMAQAISLACVDEKACGRIYNVGDPDPVSMIGWVKKIGDAAGWKGEIVIAPHNRLAEIGPFALMGINTAQDATVDSSRIRSELGYSEEVDLDEALSRTIAWERSNPISPRLMGPAFFDYETENRLADEIFGAGIHNRDETYH